MISSLLKILALVKFKIKDVVTIKDELRSGYIDWFKQECDSGRVTVHSCGVSSYMCITTSKGISIVKQDNFMLFKKETPDIEDD